MRRAEEEEDRGEARGTDNGDVCAPPMPDPTISKFRQRATAKGAKEVEVRRRSNLCSCPPIRVNAVAA